MRNKITILGCGSSLGSPWITGYIGCNKKNIKNIRSRCSAHIKYKNLSILIDTSPDIKIQMQQKHLGLGKTNTNKNKKNSFLSDFKDFQLCFDGFQWFSMVFYWFSIVF